MRNRDRIRRASRRLRRLLLIVACTIPAINAMVWVYINHFPQTIYSHMLPFFVSIPLPASARLMGFLVTMMPAAVAISGAYYLMRLFHLYEQGQIFRPSNVQCFKKLSRVLIWWFAVGIIHRSLLSVALTLHNPPGYRIARPDRPAVGRHPGGHRLGHGRRTQTTGGSGLHSLETLCPFESTWTSCWRGVKSNPMNWRPKSALPRRTSRS